MKTRSIILISLILLAFTACKKKFQEEFLYGTWETTHNLYCCCTKEKVQLTLQEEGTASISYILKSGELSYCSPCYGLWYLEKENKMNYLTLEFPDSCGAICITNSTSDEYEYCTYEIKEWDNDALLLKLSDRSRGGDDYFCSISGGFFPSWIDFKLIKLN